MPQAVRRFLRPLVGVDPGEVRVHRGELAAEVTSARHADAVTVGRDVFLAPGQGGDDPRGVGLLAHELTHVARHGQPTFIPPVSAHRRLQADTASEEGVATQVEATVRSAAASASSAGSLEAAPGAWDGLPAPWEPLPAWLTTPAADQPAEPLQSSTDVTNRPAAETIAAAPSHAAADVMAAAPGYAAETDRQLPTPEDIHTEQADQHHQDKAGAVEPDLDALARQVYTLLRRRMASERRRFY